ncbi:nitrite reductase, copper-containing [Candidatus Saccharibacteria bacterium]|jgi:nitrite reductase (NO-forming)|nr:nitrite reductase, copper-containing [Candidatus Saccharibacteria bacterium]
MYKYLIIEGLGWLFIIIVIVIVALKSGLVNKLLKFFKRKKVFKTIAVLGVLVLGVGMVLYGRTSYPVHFAMPATMHSVASDHNPPSLPLLSLWRFLTESRKFEFVKDVGADPNKVPSPINRTEPKTVELALTTKEVIAEVADGIYNNYWTFDGQAPGPMLRIREGDTVNFTLTNDNSSLHNHNIDFHATTGPGGGASVTNVKPGESRSFSWKSLAPGLYIYHCATSNVSVHNSHGQYGLILVEPKEGLSKVDKEFYLVQGELYTQGGIGKKGLQAFDPQALLDGIPTYVTFNGKIETVPRMKAKVGDSVRIYVGNGGVNLVSSFHVIGEIFDKVYPEAAMGPESAILQNVQTTTVLPGGASIVEFKVDVPGKYTIVDHALARMNKGAWAVLEVEGDDQLDIYKSTSTNTDTSHSHSSY